MKSVLEEGRHVVELRPRGIGRWITAAFLTFWLAGWAVGAVASFASASPSRMTTSRRGSSILRAMERGAMASGGDTMAPRRKPTGQARSMTQCAAAATASVVNTTPPTARSVIGRRLNWNSRQLIRKAEL